MHRRAAIRHRRRNPVALIIVLVLTVGGATAGALMANSSKPRATATGQSFSFTSPAPLPLNGKAVHSGAPAPNFAVRTLDGRRLTLADYRGQPTILFFMAYWCGGCLRTGREMSRVYDQYSAQGLQVLAVDIDPTSSPSALRGWIKADDNPRYVFSMDQGGVTSRAYGVRSLDTVVLIDKAGRIAFQGIYPSENEVKRAVAGALA